MMTLVSRALRRLTRPLVDVPWPANLLIGVALVLLGSSLVVRPFSSLTVLFILVAAVLIVEGGERIAERQESGMPLLAVAAGIALAAGGIIVLALPAIAVEALAWIVGISLLLGGAADVVGGLRGRTKQHLSVLLTGLASVVFGVLALRWPDITLLIVSVYMTARVALLGLSQILQAARKLRQRRAGDRAGHESEPGQPKGLWWLRASGSAALLLAAVGLLVLSAIVLRSPPVPDSFYDYGGEIPSAPGQLLAVEPYAGDLDNARGWRILYTTTRDADEPALGSAFVMAPVTPYDTPRPVIAWAHGTTGVLRRCAPTIIQPDLPALLESHGSMTGALENGWVIVGADYPGMGTRGPSPYLIGSGQAHSILDAVRAARQIEELSLANDVTVWGHSQGGHAALWTGMIAEEYAPDVHINGVAAGAPASDLRVLLERQERTFLGKLIGAWAIRAYSDWYPDVRFDDYIDTRVQPVVRAMSERCILDRGVVVSAVMSLALGDIMYATSPSTGPLGERLVENTPVGPISAPLQIAQGLDDPLVVADIQDDYVRMLCESGQALEYRTYAGLGHLNLVEAGSTHVDDLLAWTQARINGEPAEYTC